MLGSCWPGDSVRAGGDHRRDLRTQLLVGGDRRRRIDLDKHRYTDLSLAPTSYARRRPRCSRAGGVETIATKIQTAASFGAMSSGDDRRSRQQAYRPRGPRRHVVSDEPRRERSPASIGARHVRPSGFRRDGTAKESGEGDGDHADGLPRVERDRVCHTDAHQRAGECAEVPV